ncbi:amidophosphoribosyltransferase [uncultured Selenomonas sp.]|uniref:amidophosphoribosyltransferase n=1 Tax=uncultured Selenomonas sp. TaxID=159275 RepID=UPI0028DC99D7|nr:amidophosphoribosyltransferase [uncultured Selenomonas sp.]
MSIHEECGVFGVFSPEPTNVAAMAYYALYALQHRGQESCGITVNDDGVFSSHKDLGLVNDVFSREVLSRFPEGKIAIGHVRYGTTGATSRRNCQPLAINHQKGQMALAHNGNLSNADLLRDKLELAGAIFHTTIDTEIIAYLITQARLKVRSIEEAVSQAMNRLEGAYSLCLMSSTKLIAVRDPQGFRPLCYGRMPDGTWVVASESCALSAVGAELERDLLPGEILVFTKDGMTSRVEHCHTKPRKSCVFEYIYFARPDSIIDGVSIHAARTRAGEILAACHPVDADVVIGVPDSGLDAALGYSRASGIPYGIGLIKNKYIGRTFIAPGQENRVDKVRIKLNPIDETVRGKRVVLIDDSIVRGTTSKRITDLIRKAGAKEIHLRISAPPFLHPCYYGTDIDSSDKLVAAHHTLEEITQIVGADTLGYLPIGSLPTLAGDIPCCDACFSGDYPTSIPKNTNKNRFETKLSKSSKEEA